MRVEDRLKDLILQRYGSVLNFCTTNEMPQSTVATILRRGIQNSNFSNVVSMCDALGISVDGLADNKIIPISQGTNQSARVEDILNVTKDQLLNFDALTFERDPVSQETIDYIISAIDIGVEMAKKKKRL